MCAREDDPIVIAIHIHSVAFPQPVICTSWPRAFAVLTRFDDGWGLTIGTRRGDVEINVIAVPTREELARMAVTF